MVNWVLSRLMVPSLYLSGKLEMKKREEVCVSISHSLPPAYLRLYYEYNNQEVLFIDTLEALCHCDINISKLSFIVLIFL